MVKIQKRNKILNEVISEGKKHPRGWKAILGRDTKRMSLDYYIFNPKSGIYLLKEYQKNPYHIEGIGGKIGRKIDEDIENQISKHSGDFGIIQGNYQKILKNLEKGIQPNKIFEAAIQGKKDLGLSLPIKGQASSSKETFNNIRQNLASKQDKIDNKFEELAKKEGLYNSYG